MADDWDKVTVLHKKPTRAADLRSSKAINHAMASGAEIETKKKLSLVHGGANRNAGASTGINAAKLDQETEDFHHKKVDLDVSKLISQQRQKLGISQKDLATKICEKPQIVNEYESGKALPNQQILGKLERALGIKLRGKEKGEPLVPKGGKK